MFLVVLIPAILMWMGLREMFNVGYPACPKCGSKQKFRWNRQQTKWICQRCGAFGNAEEIW